MNSAQRRSARRRAASQIGKQIAATVQAESIDLDSISLQDREAPKGGAVAWVGLITGLVGLAGAAVLAFKYFVLVH